MTRWTEFDDIVGEDPAFKAAIEAARRAAKTDIIVLLTGGSGTGKEMLAQALHMASGRSKGPFIAVNCGAMAETLLDSELFGHEKGAFTGAVKTRRGKIELADGGTLFLDEICDMSLLAQSKLLRAIEEKRFERLGSEETILSNCRIIAATNRDLWAMVETGHFREDMYYRIKEMTIDLPALKDRRGDVPLLVDHFIEQFARELGKKVPSISQVAMSLLQRHEWPGNVRELRNVIKTGVTFAEDKDIWLEHLPLDVGLRTVHSTMMDNLDLSLAASEKKHIRAILELAGWNKAKAARLLGISRPRLDRKIQSYKLHPEE